MLVHLLSRRALARTVVAASAAWLGLAAASAPALAADKLKLLIIDGQNNHDWKVLSPQMKADLERTGRFTVDIATTPPAKAPASAWDGFRPDFSKYDVVLSNYNGERWPKPVEDGLVQYVQNGGGLVVVHAANNAFTDWPEWNRMIGLGWRGPEFGARVTVDDAGQVVRTPKGEGPGAGHGPQHAYLVTIRDAEHPITKGLPAKFLHARDELYHGQRGPAEEMHVLATAYSAKDQGGTGTNEPMVWWIPLGKGRVVTNVMGHSMQGDNTAIRCTGFQALNARAAEWAATGSVTLPVPNDLPGTDAPRLGAVAESK